MWMLPPIILCKNHLLGEHSEIHKFRPSFVKKFNIDKRMFPIVQILPRHMKKRHEELVKEMLRRGYNHKSPYTLPSLSYLPLKHLMTKPNLKYNIEDLISRCPECRKRYILYKYHNSEGL